MTLRQNARELVMLTEVHVCMRLAHMQNYHKLHVRRDGTLHWFESINPSDDIIDGGADHFAPVPSLCTTGTGSYVCNCDFCEDDGYETRAAAIADAVCEADSSFVEQKMLEELDRIPVGYFDDESMEDSV